MLCKTRNLTRLGVFVFSVCFSSLSTGAENIDRKQLFDELAGFLCSSETYLECFGTTRDACDDVMEEARQQCQDIVLLAVYGEPIREQVQEGVLTCVLEHNSSHAGLNQLEIDWCYARKNTDTTIYYTPPNE